MAQSRGVRPIGFECPLLLRVVGPLPLLDGVTGSGGRRRRSLKSLGGGNRGGIRRGGSGGSVYGDLTAGLTGPRRFGRVGLVRKG